MKRCSSISTDVQASTCYKNPSRLINPRILKIMNMTKTNNESLDVRNNIIESESWHIVQSDDSLFFQNVKDNFNDSMSETSRDIIITGKENLVENLNSSFNCNNTSSVEVNFEEIIHETIDFNNMFMMNNTQIVPLNVMQDVNNQGHITTITEITIPNTTNTNQNNVLLFDTNLQTEQDRHLNKTPPNYIININDETHNTDNTTNILDDQTTITHPPTPVIVTTECVDKIQQKRSRKSQPNSWRVKTNQINREKGKSYLGKKKIGNKWVYNEEKSERKMKESCNCKLSLKGGTKLQCGKLSQEERKKIFQQFWSLNWKEKKVFVRTTSICKETERKRGNNSTSRRKNSVELFLNTSAGDRYRVCKKMFLNTLGVGEWVIKKWIIAEPELNKAIPKNNLKTEDKNKLNAFFESLPKVESHYCRKDTSKLYLEPLWTSKTQLYKFYKTNYCSQENIKPMSIGAFWGVFEDLNLSLYRPKKDLCDICEAFKTGNITDAVYQDHIVKKEEARNEKDQDKNSEHEVLTMDLQSVLLSPKSNVSALYYKTKLIVHNFTFYDLKRKHGYCFIWNETEGNLTANEFSTIIITMLQKFIIEHPLKPNQQIIIYSDGCTYQNRNNILSNALVNFSLENKIVIIQKYLEKGHTQMECDSMHATIERCIRNKKINVPADYAYYAKIACTKKNYEVQYLYYNFFKDIENTLTFFKSIRPGKKAGDPVVTDIRALKYSPNYQKIIQFKLRHSSCWEDLPIRPKKMTFVPFESIPQLYNERIKIKGEKFRHLQELKKTMEKDYHNFYDSLPHL